MANINSDWIEQPNSPRVTSDSRGVTTEYEFVGPKGGGEYARMEITAPLYNEYQIEPMPGGYERLILRLSPSGGYSNKKMKTRKSGDIEWTLEDSGLQKPLESHSGYKMKWKYNLYWYSLAFGTAPALPAWAGTATSPDSADEKSWKWSEYSPGDDWRIAQAKTKPGIDGYVIPSPVVVKSMWFDSWATAKAAIIKAGTIASPSENFGYTDYDWLVIGASMQIDGELYLVQLRYQGATEIDGDLYD